MSTFTTTDGVALDYRVDGPADAADTLVMLHGWSQSRAMFDRALPLLSASTRVVTYDQRGHGASDKPDHGAGSPGSPPTSPSCSTTSGSRRRTCSATRW